MQKKKDINKTNSLFPERNKHLLTHPHSHKQTHKYIQVFFCAGIYDEV